MWWREFAESAPALARRLREAVFETGQLYLDVLRSRKALDVLRDTG